MDATTKSTLLQPDLGMALVAARDGRSAAERAAQAQRNRVDSLAYQAATTRKDIAATLAKAARRSGRHERQVDRVGDAVLGKDGARRVGHLLAAASPGLADPEEVDRGGHGGEEEEHFQRAERVVRFTQERAGANAQKRRTCGGRGETVKKLGPRDADDNHS